MCVCACVCVSRQHHCSKMSGYVGLVFGRDRVMDGGLLLSLVSFHGGRGCSPSFGLPASVKLHSTSSVLEAQLKVP